MANPNQPFGLRPVCYISGAPWTGGGNIYYIDSGNTDTFYPGDPVLSSGTGDGNGIAGIGIAVAGSAIRGILIGAGPILAGSSATGGGQPGGGPAVNPNDLTRISVPATKTSAYYALVMDDPNVICEIQEVYSGTAFAAVDIGLNANFSIVAPTSPNQISSTVVNNVGKATTSTLNLKLLGLSLKGANTYGAGAIWRVLLNNHEFRAGITGV